MFRACGSRTAISTVTSLAVASLAVVTTAMLLGLPILGNDDAWIRAIADGSYTGSPSERLIFMNSLLGWVLRGAYTVFPDVAWYALLLYGLVTVAIAVAVWLSLSRPVVVRVALALIALYFAARPLVVLSWTETGLLVVGAGVVLALCGPLGRAPTIVAGLLIGIGFMIRAESVGIVLTVLPLLWVVRDRWRQLFVVGLVAIGVIGPAYTYDYLHYASDPDWAEWREFEEVRRNLHGTPKVRLDSEMSDVRAAAGWSENDLRVFLRWHYADEDVFSTEAITRIHDARRYVIEHDPVLLLVSAARRHAVGIALVAVVLGLVGAHRWWIAVGSATWLIVLFTTMEVLFRTRPSIEAILVLAVALALVLLLHDEDRDRLVQPLVVVAALVLSIPGLIEVSAEARGARSQRADQMRVLEQVDRDAIYISVAGVLQQGLSPFNRGTPPVKMVLTGWTVRSPHFAAHLKQVGIEDLYLDPVRRRDVLLVGKEAPVASIAEFVREHYGIDTRAELIARVDDSVNVWQFG